MSEENVAAVRAVYEEFARGDFGALGGASRRLRVRCEPRTA